MTAPLVPINVPSIYTVAGEKVPLPKRMAQCTTDMKAAIVKLGDAVKAKGGRFVLSDLFRSYDMQLQAHLDFVTKKKKAFSPPPGGGLHEAGRAFDVDLQALKMPLSAFWELAAAQGIVPIIDKPEAKLSESWHFECRGSHQLVYDYYKAGKGTNFGKPYEAMAASAILSVGIKVDRFAATGSAARLQSALIRLGHDIGNMDGAVGPKSNKALGALGVAGMGVEQQLQALEEQLQAKFPAEFFDAVPAPFEFGDA